MNKKQMQKCLKKNESQIKVYSFNVRMNNLGKREQEAVRSQLEKKKFKDEDSFLRRIRFNVASVI